MNPSEKDKKRYWEVAKQYFLNIGFYPSKMNLTRAVRDIIYHRHIAETPEEVLIKLYGGSYAEKEKKGKKKRK